VLAVARHADVLDVVDQLATAVAQDQLLAVLAAQAVLEGPLQSLLADLVFAGEADHVGKDLAGRVVALVLALEVEAAEAERRGTSSTRLASAGGMRRFR
jgi:hypothetical protein